MQNFHNNKYATNNSANGSLREQKYREQQMLCISTKKFDSILITFRRSSLMKA